MSAVYLESMHGEQPTNFARRLELFEVASRACEERKRDTSEEGERKLSWER